jgi:hypothetical protein
MSEFIFSSIKHFANISERTLNYYFNVSPNSVNIAMPTIETLIHNTTIKYLRLKKCPRGRKRIETRVKFKSKISYKELLCR